MIIDNLNEKKFNILGKNNSLKGEFKLSGLTRISCDIEGTLNHVATDTEQELLIIEREGKLKGNITGHNMEIFGEFDGSINSKGRVILHSGSKIKGKIQAFNLIIYPGSHVEIEGHTDQTMN